MPSRLVFHLPVGFSPSGPCSVGIHASKFRDRVIVADRDFGINCYEVSGPRGIPLWNIPPGNHIGMSALSPNGLLLAAWNVKDGLDVYNIQPSNCTFKETITLPKNFRQNRNIYLDVAFIHNRLQQLEHSTVNNLVSVVAYTRLGTHTYIVTADRELEAETKWGTMLLQGVRPAPTIIKAIPTVQRLTTSVEMNHVRGAETGYVGSVAASNPLLLNTPPTKSNDPRSVRLQRFAYEVDFDKETIRIAEVDGSPHQEEVARHDTVLPLIRGKVPLDSSDPMRLGRGAESTFPPGAYFAREIDSASASAIDTILVLTGPLQTSSTTYWSSAGAGSLISAPHPNPQQEPGHILIHTNILTGDKQVWVLLEDSQEVKSPSKGVCHPMKPNAYFKMLKNGKPSWVLWDTLRCQKGKKPTKAKAKKV
ncbi:hypothetical protein CPB85DRAFT_1253926 [Mucidula mucida]|nr:hypothetical protein CPB85DRAFT_1253926 [Mucidula mucida]